MNLLKKHIFFLSCLLLIVDSLNCQTLIKSIISHRDSMWYETQYTYNNKNQISSTITKNSINKNNWKKFTKSNYIYNNNKISAIEKFLWIDGQWKKKYYHNKNFTNNIITGYTYVTFEETSTTKNTISLEFGKDFINELDKIYINDNLKYTITKKYLFKNSHIDKIEINNNGDNITISFSYSNNKINEIILSEKHNVGFSPIMKTKYYYNEKGLENSEVQYNYINGKWFPIAKHSFKYNIYNDIKDITYFTWNQRFWSNSLKKEYKYNKERNIDSYKILFPVFNTWKEYYSAIYSYNQNELLENIFFQNEFWANNQRNFTEFIKIPYNNLDQYELADNITLNYTTKTPTNIIITKKDLSIFPNPSTDGIFYFKFPDNVYSIYIYDLNGILISIIDNPNNTINLSNFNPGIYLAKFLTNEGAFTNKLIINK